MHYTRPHPPHILQPAMFLQRTATPCKRFWESLKQSPLHTRDIICQTEAVTWRKPTPKGCLAVVCLLCTESAALSVFLSAGRMPACSTRGSPIHRKMTPRCRRLWPCYKPCGIRSMRYIPPPSPPFTAQQASLLGSLKFHVPYIEGPAATCALSCSTTKGMWVGIIHRLHSLENECMVVFLHPIVARTLKYT